MTRPVLAHFDMNDTSGRAWEAFLLGAEPDTPCCGIVLPAALLRIVVPKEMSDPFGPGQTADFDVSDSPLVSLVSVMGLAGPASVSPHPDEGRRD